MSNLADVNNVLLTKLVSLEVLEKVAEGLQPYATAVMDSVSGDDAPTGEPAVSLKALVERMAECDKFAETLIAFNKRTIRDGEALAPLMLMFILGIRAAELALAEGVKV